jgi:hypothetical protein
MSGPVFFVSLAVATDQRLLSRDKSGRSSSYFVMLAIEIVAGCLDVPTFFLLHLESSFIVYPLSFRWFFTLEENYEPQTEL